MPQSLQKPPSYAGILAEKLIPSKPAVSSLGGRESRGLFRRLMTSNNEADKGRHCLDLSSHLRVLLAISMFVFWMLHPFKCANQKTSIGHCHLSCTQINNVFRCCCCRHRRLRVVLLSYGSVIVLLCCCFAVSCQFVYK